MHNLPDQAIGLVDELFEKIENLWIGGRDV